ncbi:hypothetical protein [Acinetobacter pragensis]|uniref:hypothetical protein n=1 Tax=Acinetobacter pragensis TaxID=1806892 RepID=UPI00333F5702
MPKSAGTDARTGPELKLCTAAALAERADVCGFDLNCLNGLALITKMIHTHLIKGSGVQRMACTAMDTAPSFLIRLKRYG